jgi:c-di-GMP-binding flagellar brake protein YcgR
MAMNSGDKPERRHGQRVALEPGIECRLELRTRVRLLDISLTGALLGTDLTLPVGTKAHLRSAIAATAFSPDVQVRRTADVSGRNASVGLGALFTTMDERSQRSLEEFLRKANT